MDMAIGVAAGLLGGTLGIVAMVLQCGGFQRAAWGLNLAKRAHQDPSFAEKVNALAGVAVPPAAPATAKPSGEALRLLALLQGEARLLDFLLEDISAYEDGQVGQAVREIHQKSHATLQQHLDLQPVIASAEGHVVTVQSGYDPSAILLLGNVTGHPPYSGELQHPGWRVRALKLPPLPAGQDPFVLQPAEVQVA